MHLMRIILLAFTCLITNVATAQVAKEPTQRFLDWDVNKDGKLTKDELPLDLQPNFDKVDTNKDGSISPEEDAQQPGGRLDGVKIDREVRYAADENPRHTLDLYRPKYGRSKTTVSYTHLTLPTKA